MARISIRRLDGELKRVQAFYELTEYGGGVQPDDLVIGAVAEDDRVVGGVRVANEHDVLVARGMRVLPEFQRQGIGRQMLEELQSILQGQECFGIAYAHLEGFYGQIGLCKTDERTAPVFLRQRIEKYRRERPGQQFVLLKKPL